MLSAMRTQQRATKADSKIENAKNLGRRRSSVKPLGFGVPVTGKPMIIRVVENAAGLGATKESVRCLDVLIPPKTTSMAALCGVVSRRFSCPFNALHTKTGELVNTPEGLQVGEVYIASAGERLDASSLTVAAALYDPKRVEKDVDGEPAAGGLFTPTPCRFSITKPAAPTRRHSGTVLSLAGAGRASISKGQLSPLGGSPQMRPRRHSSSVLDAAALSPNSGTPASFFKSSFCDVPSPTMKIWPSVSCGSISCADLKSSSNSCHANSSDEDETNKSSSSSTRGNTANQSKRELKFGIVFQSDDKLLAAKDKMGSVTDGAHGVAKVHTVSFKAANKPVTRTKLLQLITEALPEGSAACAKIFCLNGKEVHSVESFMSQEGGLFVATPGQDLSLPYVVSNVPWYVPKNGLSNSIARLTSEVTIKLVRNGAKGLRGPTSVTVPAFACFHDLLAIASTVCAAGSIAVLYNGTTGDRLSSINDLLNLADGTIAAATAEEPFVKPNQSFTLSTTRLSMLLDAPVRS
ncbi:hypothetical protein DIPPA_08513 [Diplonema papillatum]|nr:hypothetical protein DIPPA_08513 [Diplonema papillatum]|eukprot:gene10090-15511_t